VVGFIEGVFLHDQGLIFQSTGGYGEMFLFGAAAIPGWILCQWGTANPLLRARPMPKGSQGQKRRADVIGDAILIGRIARLTVAHSKKLANHALALCFPFCNFIKRRSTLRVSSAMEAGITDRLWEMSDMVALIDAANPPKPHGPYKKKAA
jgi:hypothetical protein